MIEADDTYTTQQHTTHDDTKTSSYNPPNAHYSEVKCDLSQQQIKKLIGKNGYFFNVITKAAKVNYLWFDNQRQVIEIWGPMIHLENAKRRLIDRMEHVVSM